MKTKKFSKKPTNFFSSNADPVIVYPNQNLGNLNLDTLLEIRKKIKKIKEIVIPPRDAKCFEVKFGQFFRIESFEGPQVGDLNIFKSENLKEKFFSGKSRAFYGTHLSTGDKLFSNLPYLRSLATITWDTLDWYGYDSDGGSVHDVIGTRCDPYTEKLINKKDYHYCCHSNLTRALVREKKINAKEAEFLVHDVLNVFMCTGFTNNTKQYFMKASPARPGDYLEFFAETDLLGVLSACPGGDCSTTHSSDEAKCYPLKVSIWSCDEKNLTGISPSSITYYDNSHGLS
tara:strand:- start:1722 stop:2582 length:861 start_codon:yes stop_codon:yes gene_type:complete